MRPCRREEKGGESNKEDKIKVSKDHKNKDDSC
jgi:hypothetical protein